MQNIYTRNYYYTRLLSIIINIFIYYIYLFQFRLRSCVRARLS
uniref:Ryanodine receptor n=1 Tax=Siphoviridae sp. ctLfk13 TaxID=2826251 RepID=A0A8S5N2P2_9CAUD|nr:MAG TPA: ryanodine receptor [Siphoviridae sp. ctLfk13]